MRAAFCHKLTLSNKSRFLRKFTSDLCKPLQVGLAYTLQKEPNGKNPMTDGVLPRIVVSLRSGTSWGLLAYLGLLMIIASGLAWMSDGSVAVCGVAGALLLVAALVGVARSATDLATRVLMATNLAIALMLLIFAASALGDGAVQQAHMMYFVTNAFLLTYMCWRSQLVYNVLVVGHHLVMTFLAPALIWHTSNVVHSVSNLVVHAAIATILVPTLLLVGHSLLTSMVKSTAALEEANAETRRADTAMQAAQKAMGEAQLATKRADDGLAAQVEADEMRRHVVESVADALGQLADGRLIVRLSEPFDPAYEKLRSDFNAALDKLQRTMVGIADNAAAIHGGTQDMSAAADSLARRTEHQAASLEQTAAALNQITTTVHKSADAAKSVNAAVAIAKRDAEVSGAVVTQAVEAMGAIKASSEEITQIIGVIDEIAFQTNLLALNAGVEAARAGDAGRGFAVVASEVRALAQRSAESAREIKNLIVMSSRQVQDGVELVDKTGAALGRIVNQVAGITGLINEVANSAQEQSTSLKEINVAINQMDHMTQQNAAMVEESTAATHAMITEVGELTRRIAQFQIGSDPEQAPKARASRSEAEREPNSGTGRSREAHGGAPRPAPSVYRPKVAVGQSATWEEF